MLRSRGKAIYRDFGRLPSKDLKDWASRFSHFTASGITSWLDQVCPGLSEAERRRITKSVNAGLWASRHDAMNRGAIYYEPDTISDDVEEKLCEEIDRRASGEYESYGQHQPVAIGAKVIVAIDRHMFQGFVGTVLSKRPDEKYQVEFYTRKEKVTGYFVKEELIALRTYVRSKQYEKVQKSRNLGKGNTRS